MRPARLSAGWHEPPFAQAVHALLCRGQAIRGRLLVGPFGRHPGDVAGALRVLDSLRDRHAQIEDEPFVVDVRLAGVNEKALTVVLEVARVTGGTSQSDIILCQVPSVLRQRRVPLAPRVLHHSEGQASGAEEPLLAGAGLPVIVHVEESVGLEVGSGRKQSLVRGARDRHEHIEVEQVRPLRGQVPRSCELPRILPLSPAIEKAGIRCLGLARWLVPEAWAQSRPDRQRQQTHNDG